MASYIVIFCFFAMEYDCWINSSFGFIIVILFASIRPKKIDMYCFPFSMSFMRCSCFQMAFVTS
jgi:hypothetical protein